MTIRSPDPPPTDPVIIPVSITIPDPRQERPSGLPRLRRSGVRPANGWARSPSMKQE